MADGQDGKPSRYRSQRKAPSNSSPHTTADGIGRSKSRYHHTRPATAHAQDQQADQTPDDQADLPSRSRSTRGRTQDREVEAGATDQSTDDDQRRQHGSTRSHHKSVERSPSPTRVDRAQFYDAPTNLRAKAEDFLPDADPGDISAEESSGFCGMFGRKKKKNKPSHTAARNTPNARPAAPRAAEPVRPGGGGVVPMTDAPLSAANAGQRRVLVECNDKSIFLPVDGNVTATDVIASAANCLSTKIDIRNSVLLEHFQSVGVTRPIRRYEHIKDVMNSWDDDAANSLWIVPSSALEVNAANLSATNAPREKPRECSFLVLYSQKPGSWDKRLVTLRQDGQIVVAKPNKEKETTNVCHLSDFDIYTPTAKQLSKKIKPPKKTCYAIKSQQKTSMFISTSTYVHFFCTSERTLATSFYDAVQSWRSWYLVNVMGEGKKTKTTELGRSSSKATKQSKQSSHVPQPSAGSTDDYYHIGANKPFMDPSAFDRPVSSQGQEAFSKAPTTGSAIGSNGSNSVPSRKLSTRDRSHPPVSLPKTQQLTEDEPLVNLAANRAVTSESDATDNAAFTGDGLLGRSYSTRQKIASEREAAAKNPWVTGPSLLSGDQAEGLNRQTSIKRTGSTRRSGGGSGQELRHRPSTRERIIASEEGLRRSGSGRTRDAQKPLVDLTPAYKPPPQHHKKGKGYHPDQVGPGGLIDNATSPDQAYYIPPSQDWRAGRSNPPATGGSLPSRQRSLAHRPGPNPNDEAFTGHGLVDSGSGGYSGNRSVGRGVMSGNRNAQQPMLDVSEESNFVRGSLLNQVARAEREEGRGGPIIDRSR